MATASPKLSWCVVRLGEDTNWWVEEISDNVHWDVDGLSIIDPRQFIHIMDLMDPLTEYGLDSDILESAFFSFSIDEKLDNGRVRLTRSKESLLESEETLFALPNVVDEEKGPYADFLNHITRLRVKMLNDVIDFKQQLTIEELEEEIRESQNQDFLEGRAVHFFNEITSILEYVPEGFELDEDESDGAAGEDINEEFPDLDDSDEKIEEDETMRWDEENGDEDFDEDEDLDDEDDDEDKDEDDEEDDKNPSR